jgi:hypothetical protein
MSGAVAPQIRGTAFVQTEVFVKGTTRRALGHAQACTSPIYLSETLRCVIVRRGVVFHLGMSASLITILCKPRFYRFAKNARMP